MNIPGKRTLRIMALLSGAMLCANASNAAVEISAKPTVNMTCSGGVCSPTAEKAVLNVNDLAGMLASGDVSVTSGSQAKDIEIDAALSWASTHHLTLDSYHAIAFNKAVEVTGTGALTITTNDGGSGGDFQFFGKGHVEFWDVTSNLVINGQAYSVVKSIDVFARLLRHSDGTGLHLAQPSDWHIRGNHRKSPLSQFNGSFEGLGNKIANLTIKSSETHVALFESIDQSGLIRDVTLTSIDITGTGFGQFIGGLAAGNEGVIFNCHVSGTIVSSQNNSVVGGLTDINAGSVFRSSSVISINADDGTLYTGGLIGHNIEDGGTNPGVVEDSYATGSVVGGQKVGGLIGETDGGIISNSYSTGAVSGSSGGSVGGFIGWNAVGQDFESTPTSISSSYSTGAVSGGDGAVIGGYLGTDMIQSGIGNSYWDLDTSGISDPAQGAGNVANDPGITGLTDAELKSSLPPGFDKKVWKKKSDLNNGYPYLIASPPTK